MLTICDPHIHLWDLTTGLYPRLETPSVGITGNNAAIARSYLLPEFLGEGGRDIAVTGAVHVEAFPTDGLAEVRHMQSVADSADIPIGLVGNVDLTRHDLSGLLDQMCQSPQLRGIRQVVNLHDEPALSYVSKDYLSDPAFHRGFAELATRGLSFDLQLYPHQAQAAADLITENAGVPVVVNHACMWADRTLSGWKEWKAALRTLAACPDTSIKISGLGAFDHNWTANSLRPIIFETLEAFGTDRTMFASNFPVDKLFGSYAALWKVFDEAVYNLGDRERASLFHDNAARFYRLG